MNNVRHKTRRTFWNKKWEYMKEEKLMNLKETVRTKISETYTEAQMKLIGIST
jgi:hypothetical protein